VTEVATRALKAVRFQKFNNHIRLRPEALAARVHLLKTFDGLSEAAKQTIPPALQKDMGKFAQALDTAGILDAVKTGPGQGNYFLPMAFPEGSPMHPAYGAGHATVAGACVTILKAFFDTSAVLAKFTKAANQCEEEKEVIAFKRLSQGDIPIAFRPPRLPHPNTGEGVPAQTHLDSYTPDCFLTLEGELNKLAANIAIGRNMAGVHYFSDYYDSLRMGEKIALGILEEQALTYSTDPCVFSVPTFDGDVVRIGRR
jgi:hypothetical protein